MHFGSLQKASPCHGHFSQFDSHQLLGLSASRFDKNSPKPKGLPQKFHAYCISLGYWVINIQSAVGTAEFRNPCNSFSASHPPPRVEISEKETYRACSAC